MVEPKKKRAVSPLTLVIVVIVLIVASVTIYAVYVIIMVPPIGHNQVSITPITNSANSGVWTGNVIVSDAGIMQSVKVANGSNGVMNDTILEPGDNTMSVTFTGLAAGTYDIIFTFSTENIEYLVIEAISVTFT